MYIKKTLSLKKFLHVRNKELVTSSTEYVFKTKT